MTSGKRNALIAVTHLLGVGHFARSAALGAALNRAGWSVTLLSGGRPVQNIDTSGMNVIQLPPVHCRHGDFSRLLGDNGDPISAETFAERAALARAAVLLIHPDVVITELYPFGRRALSAEYEALLAALREMAIPPALICSIRDVLNPPSKPRRSSEVLDRLSKYDGIIIHGDPVMPLERSWPVDRSLARKMVYAGYLRDNTRSQPVLEGSRARDGILVSAGGSDAGITLNRVVLGAALAMPERSFHLLVSQAIGEAEFVALARLAPPNAKVDRARPDFPELLCSAGLSISQAGYNTVLDLAAAGIRSVLVPYSAGSEQEQTIRAEALAQAGLARVVPEADLDVASLVSAIRQSLDGPAPDWSVLSLDGDVRAVAAIHGIATEKQAINRAWRRLNKLLERSEASGRHLDLWIRDDDAAEDTPELRKFLSLLAKHGVPAALAAIPAAVSASLALLLEDHRQIAILQHGYAHNNHAPDGEKSAEFGPHRALAEMELDVARGWKRLDDAFGSRALPVFVPPWNRIAPDLALRLPSIGILGLSTFGLAGEAAANADVLQRNSEWDPIDWRGHRGLKPRALVLDQLCDLIETRLGQEGSGVQPIGLLTHHLIHDGWLHEFLSELVSRLAQSRSVRFLAAAQVFRGPRLPG